MDLLDFWKCHLCHHADYLFLMVPQALKHNDHESEARVQLGREATRDILHAWKRHQRPSGAHFGY